MRQAIKFSTLLLACLLVPVLWLMLFPLPPTVYFLWDWANALGYLTLTACLILFIYRGRPQAFPAFSGRFFANLHRDLGYVALIFLAGHVGILLFVEPLLLEHLKPTAPLHMLSGLGAMVLMTLLAIFSIPKLRRRLWRNYHQFRHVHALLAVSAVALTVYHVVVSGFYLDSQWKVGLLVAACLGTLGCYLWGKNTVVGSSHLRRRNSASYSKVISYGCMITAGLSCAVLIVLNTPP